MTANPQQQIVLLPCPFCGGIEISRRRRVIDYKGEAMQIFCLGRNCEGAGPIASADTLEEAHRKAESAWNYRGGEVAIRDALRVAMEACRENLTHANKKDEQALLNAFKVCEAALGQ